MKNWMQKLEEDLADNEPTCPSVRVPHCANCEEPTEVIPCAPCAPTAGGTQAMAPGLSRGPVPLSFSDEIGSNEDEWEVETLPEIGYHELGGEGGL